MNALVIMLHSKDTKAIEECGPWRMASTYIRVPGTHSMTSSIIHVYTISTRGSKSVSGSCLFPFATR